MSAAGMRNASLDYDPTGRLFETSGGGITTRFLYDGDALVGEYSASGALLRRYVHGPGVDEPLLWYEGAGLSDRRGLLANHQGSIVGVTNSGGVLLHRNTYEEYGAFGPSNGGRFSFTEQIVIPELALLHYKARAYNAALGRFLQTDPVGYDDDLNLYQYAYNDPLNKSDPTGKFVPVAVATCAVNPACAAAAIALTAATGLAIKNAVDRMTSRNEPADQQSQPTAESDAESAATPQKDKAGTAGGDRAGKPFTPKGKREVTGERAAETGGNPSCVDCGDDTNDPKKTEKGGTRDPRERNVDHIIDRANGGDGSPSDGAIRCFECNVRKPPRVPNE